MQISGYIDIPRANGSSSRISMGQKLSSIRMGAAIILSPWIALRGKRPKVPADIEFNAEFLAKKLARNVAR